MTRSTRATIDRIEAHVGPGRTSVRVVRSSTLPSSGASQRNRPSTSVPVVSSTSPGSVASRPTDIDDSGVAPLASRSSTNGVPPTAARRSASAKESNPSVSASCPVRWNVVVSPDVSRVRLTSVNGGPRLASRLLASSADETGCRNVTERPPSAVAVGPSTTQPAAAASSKRRSSASPGT